MASQTNRCSRDNNVDGLVDESNRIKLSNQKAPLSLRNWKGEALRASSKRSDVMKAVVGRSGFKALFQGQGPQVSHFRLLVVNASLIVNSEADWQRISRALRKGWESVFGDFFQNDGAIGLNVQPDANGDGLFDRGQGRVYRMVPDSDEMVRFCSKQGEPLSRKSLKLWDAVQALRVEDGFQVLLHKGSPRKPAFKLLNFDVDGITTEKSSWLSQAEALFAAWDARFMSLILAPASIGGTLVSAMVDGNEADEQLIRTVFGVTLSLQSLDSGSLSGLSISAESG